MEEPYEFDDLLDLQYDDQEFSTFASSFTATAPQPTESNLQNAESTTLDFPLRSDGSVPSCSSQGLTSIHQSLSSTGEQTNLPAFDDFPSWLPRFSRPPTACDYCSILGFNCFFTNGDETGCSSCKSLFRVCTFRSKRPCAGWLDTLGTVSEDVPQDSLCQVSRRPLFSQGASMDEINTIHMTEKPNKTSASRFPRAVASILKRWIETHAHHPYPTEEEKEALRAETGLTVLQISNWLANARRRGPIRPKRAASPSVYARTQDASTPISIPRPPTDQATLNPLERWKNSPPEQEAPIDLIKEAAATNNYHVDSGSSSPRSHSQTGRTLRSSGGSRISSSTSSVDHTSSRNSTNGSDSVYTHTSRQSLSSRPGRRRRRMQAKMKLEQVGGAAASAPKIYQCTFCTDSFHIKYDWTRHEKTLHLSLEKWICAPLGPVITSTASGETTCVYCDTPNPSPAHIESHFHHECAEKGIEGRTFYRKDHLRQHLRLVHRTPFTPAMEAWKSSPPVLRSRCGFCPPEAPTTFTTWQARADHIARHYRDGTKIEQWKGDHGFDPDVAAHVANAIPPWFIGFEARTPNPFGIHSGDFTRYAEDLPAMDIDGDELDRADPSYVQHLQPPTAAERGRGPGPSAGSKACLQMITCLEVATDGLGKYVHQQMERGIRPTDADLQREGRILIFGEDDAWNTTCVDNAEWLRLFKAAHGLDRENPDVAVHAQPASAPALAAPAEDEVSGLFRFDEDEDEDFMRLFSQAGISGDEGALQQALAGDEQGYGADAGHGI